VLYQNIYEMIAAKGKTLGIPPSPFGPLGNGVTKKNGPDPLAVSRMGRVGGMGNGGGKMLTAHQQGRGFLNQNG
jgi:hypothetical protein